MGVILFWEGMEKFMGGKKGGKDIVYMIGEVVDLKGESEGRNLECGIE